MLFYYVYSLDYTIIHKIYSIITVKLFILKVKY